MTFSTVGDSRQDPITLDKAIVGNTLIGQGAIWLQNTKAFARILRSAQAQKSSLMFFDGDMVHGYGWAGFGCTSNAAQTSIAGPVAPASVADIVGSDLFKFHQQYGFRRGMVAPMLELGIYAVLVPGNRETQLQHLASARRRLPGHRRCRRFTVRRQVHRRHQESGHRPRVFVGDGEAVRRRQCRAGRLGLRRQLRTHGAVGPDLPAVIANSGRPTMKHALVLAALLTWWALRPASAAT